MEEKKSSRFLDMQALEIVTSNAALTTNKKDDTKKTKAKKNILIYNLEQELYDAIDATGESFSSFAKRAILKLAKAEEIYSR